MLNKGINTHTWWSVRLIKGLIHKLGGQYAMQLVVQKPSALTWSRQAYSSHSCKTLIALNSYWFRIMSMSKHDLAEQLHN